jgi:hypothetical protein
MAAHIENACAVGAKLHNIAFVHNAVQRLADALDFARACDDRAGLGFDGGVAAGVVGVPVRVPDVGDAPALGLGLAQIFFGVGRINRCGRAAGRIVRQETVIVGQAWELMNLKHCGDWRLGFGD